MSSARLAILSTAISAALAASCRAAVSPMDYLHADGPMSATVLPLTRALLIVSIVVVVIIAALVLIAILRGARRGAVAETPLLDSEGRGWISIGVGLSTVVLIGLVVWTSMTMAGIANPPVKPARSIEVRGHQW
jgi:cytochrome c oxidase subunit II